MKELKVGFIGVGKMGSAIVKAVGQKLAGSQLYLNNLDLNAIAELADNLGAHLVPAEAVAEEIIATCDVIVLGVTPNVIHQVLKDYQSAMHATNKTLWVSMAAGVQLTSLTALTPDHHEWVRIMPNTPVEIGAGFISYVGSDNTSTASLDLVVDLLAAGGQLAAVPEPLFDAATGVAGCGPAFVYQIIEAMSDAGVAAGLPRDLAIQAAAQTVQGAGQMVLETNAHPGELKDQVTSPAGSTIAGVNQLEKEGLRGTMIAGVTAAIERNEALGKAHQ